MVGCQRDLLLWIQCNRELDLANCTRIVMCNIAMRIERVIFEVDNRLIVIFFLVLVIIIFRSGNEQIQGKGPTLSRGEGLKNDVLARYLTRLL